jgi:transcriptional regulator with XRE-family HTH domain
MSVSDAEIGANLLIRRGEMSQKDLAAAMKVRGWKWSQATVWSIEKGERPLRLAEAEDVAAILRTNVAGLARAPLVAKVDQAAKQLGQAGHDVRQALLAYRQAQTRLALSADLAVSEGVDLPLDGSFVEQRLRVSFADLVAESEVELQADELRNDQWLMTSKRRSAETRSARGDSGQESESQTASPSRHYVELLLSLREEQAHVEHPEAP